MSPDPIMSPVTETAQSGGTGPGNFADRIHGSAPATVWRALAEIAATAIPDRTGPA